MKSFIEKYKPKLSAEIPQQLDIIKKTILEKKHVLICGPIGSCKTSAVYTIANELDYEIVEMNASDFRTKDQISSILGQASQQKSLFGKEKLLLIDEVECLSGMQDRGGIQAIIEVLKKSKVSVILTANNKYSDKLKEIKKIAEEVEFKPVKSRDINSILKKICESEKIKFSEDSLRQAVINSNGDLRAAINELQSNIINKELDVMENQRDYELDVIYMLNTIFKTKNIKAYQQMENLNVNLDEYLLWLEENLPIEYKDSEDLFKAYELLSKADVFKGRIIRRQYWRLMYYQSILATSGISIAKKNINNSFTQYKRPMKPLRIWQINMKISRKKSIAEKIAKYTHSSIKNIINSFNQYGFIKNNLKLCGELKLDMEEIEYLKKI